MSCPPGYTLDGRTGYCVAPCQGGYSYFQGECIQQCPANTRVNDQKICVRPTFSRAMFTSEGLQANTTLVFGGQTNQDGQILIGTYENGDYVFGTKLQTTGPVTKVLRTKNDSFYAFQDTVNGIPIQSFSLSNPTLQSFPALPYTDVSTATYLPYSDTFVVASSPTQLSYVNATTKQSTLAYDAAKDRDEDEVLVYKGGTGTFSGSAEGGGILTTNGSIQIGSKRTNGNPNMDDFTLIYDVRTRNLGGLLYSGTDTKVKYSYRTGSNTNSIITTSNSTNYESSDIFRFDNPFSTNLSALDDFSLYVFVRKSLFETPAPFLSYIYEYRSYSDFKQSTAQWTSGPILPENPKLVTITGSSFVSATSLPQDTLVYDISAQNTYYFTQNQGTSGTVVPAPKYSRTATSFGPNAIGVSMAYQDPITNFTAFATKSASDIPDPTTIQSLAVSFSNSSLESLQDYFGSTDVNTPVTLTNDKTKISIESWNGNAASSAWTPVTVNVPAGATKAYVYMWGAGGGGYSGGVGGAGGYVSALVDLTGLTTLQVVVGAGGDQSPNANPKYFVGGIVDGGSGGGRSALVTNNSDLITAGGGGGAQGGYGGPGGQGSSSPINGLTDDKTYDPTVCGSAATSGVGKNASESDSNAVTPGQYVPGQSSFFAGGGSGYYGGGCAASANAGGGGGSSFTGTVCITGTIDLEPGTLAGPFMNSLYPEFAPAKGGSSVQGNEGFVLIQFILASSSSTPGPNRQLYLSKTNVWFTSLASFPFVTATIEGKSLSNPVTALCYSSNTILLATDADYDPYVPGTSYMKDARVKYQGTTYTALTNTTTTPLTSDWTSTDSTSLYYATLQPSTTNGFTTFASQTIDFGPVLVDGAPLVLSGLNAIRVYPQTTPTFVLLGSGYSILEKTSSGSGLWTFRLGSFTGYEATDFNCIDGGYEAGQNSFTLAAVPKQLSLGFSFQTKYAPTFAGTPVPNPYTQNGSFSQETLFATNGSITVAVGGPLQKADGTPYGFTNYNITWAPGSSDGAYVSYATTYASDMRYTSPTGSHVALPISSSSFSFLSPANVLVTASGTSYSLVKDARNTSNYLFTFMNTFLPNSSTVTTAQFTDVLYVPLTTVTGYFLATGVALWDQSTLFDSTWTQNVPSNVVWISNTLTSLDDFTNATLWKPISVLTNNQTDRLRGVKLSLVDTTPYLITEAGAYKLSSFTSTQCTGVLVGNSGIFPTACTNTDCNVCLAGSYAEVVVTVESAGGDSVSSVVCLNATSQNVANADANLINGFAVPLTPTTQYTAPGSDLLVELWGAGGSNSGSVQTGGAGGYVSAILKATQNGTPVNLPPLTMITGMVGTNTTAGGFGMTGSTSNGGGYSGIFVSTPTGIIPLVIAPGGGGGGAGSDLATGGGGGSSSNAVVINSNSESTTVPESATPSADGTNAIVDNEIYTPSAQSVIGAGAGGGYPLGTPGLLIDTVTLGGSGGAFYPVTSFSTTVGSITISVDLVTTEPGNTLPIAYTSVKAIPGGSTSPSWVSPAGSTNENGLIRVTPQNSAQAFTVPLGPLTAVGLSQFPNTISALLPVPSVQSLIVPVDPGFQTSTNLSIVGTKYLSKFTSVYGTIPIPSGLISNVLTRSGLSNQNASTLSGKTFDDLVTLDVLSSTNAVLTRPSAPSITGTMPQLNETNVTYTLTTSSWDNGTTPTLSNYIPFANGPSTNPIPVPVDPTMQAWLNFGTFYTNASNDVILVHGPGDCVIQDAVGSGTLVQYNWPTVNNPYLLSPGQTITIWDPPNGPVKTPSLSLPPDPILTLGVSVSNTLPPGSQSLAAMASTTFLRPRNWAFTRDFTVSSSSTSSYTLLTSLGIGSSEFASPDPDFRANQVGTDSILNTIVGVGRYPMYSSLDQGTTWTSYWPAWSGLPLTLPTGVTYSVRTEQLVNPKAFFYMQKQNTFLQSPFVFYFFVEVDTPNYTFVGLGDVSSALGQGTKVYPNADASDSVIRDAAGRVFDPMQHLFFIDPLQAFTNANVPVVKASQSSSAVWNMSTILRYLNTANATGTSQDLLRSAHYYSTGTITKLYLSRNHVVGLGTSLVYDTSAGVSAPTSYTITSTKAYVCYAYSVTFPSLQIQLNPSKRSLDPRLFSLASSTMNLNGLSLNVEPVNGQPQIPSTNPGIQIANVDTFVDAPNASGIVNAQNSPTTNGLLFTRYIKDPLGLSSQYFASANTYFPCPVVYPNVHYTPAYKTVTNVFGYNTVTSGSTWSVLDPTFYFVSENLLGVIATGGKNPLTKSLVGVFESLDYSTLTYYTQNVFGSTGTLFEGLYVPWAFTLDSTSIPTPISGFQSVLKDMTQVTCIAPSVMTSTTSGFQGRLTFDHDTALSLNQYSPTYSSSTNEITLQNLELQDVDLPTLADFRNNSSVQKSSLRLATFYVSAPGNSFYLANIEPTSSGTNEVLVDDLYSLDSGTGYAVYKYRNTYTSLLNALFAASPPNGQFFQGGLGGSTGGGSGSFAPGYYPSGGQTGGDGFGTYNPFSGSLPSQFLASVPSTINGTSYKFDGNTTNVPNVLNVTASPASSATQILWDTTGSCLAFSYRRDRLDPNNSGPNQSSDSDQVPPQYLIEVMKLSTSTTQTVVLDTTNPPAAVTSIVNVLNQAVVPWNNQMNATFGSSSARVVSNLNTFVSRIDNTTSRLIETYFGSKLVAGSSYLTVTCCIGTGRGGDIHDFGWDQSYAYYAYVMVNFRFCDPMTRKLLGVTRATRLLTASQVSYNNENGQDPNYVYEYTFIFPDPIDFNVNTKILHVVGSGSTSGTYAKNQAGNDNRSLSVYITTNVDDIPLGIKTNTVSVNGQTGQLQKALGLYTGPCDVMPIYNNDTNLSTIFSNSKNPNINTSPATGLGASNSLNCFGLTGLQTVPNFNGYPGYFNGSQYTFVKNQWIFWPFSNRRKMTQYNSNSYALIQDPTIEPEFTVLASKLFITSPFAKGSVSPKSLSPLEGTTFALLGTSAGDIRLLNLADGSINAATSGGAFKKKNVPQGVSTVSEVFTLGIHYFALTNDGVFTTYNAKNAQSDLLSGNLQAITFVPLFDVSGQAAFPVSGTNSYLSTLQFTLLKKTGSILVCAGSTSTSSYLVFLWMFRSKLLYSIATTSSVLGHSILQSSILAMTSTGLRYATADSFWNTPKTGSLSLVKSNVFRASATIGLPDYDQGSQNDIVTILSSLQTELNSALDTLPYLVTANPMVPLYPNPWSEAISLFVFYNASPPAGFEPPTNIEGVTVLVQFSDVSPTGPFVIAGTPGFPVSGIFMDTLSQHLLNYRTQTLSFPYATSPTQSLLESYSYENDSYPNFYRNVFFKVKKSGTATLTKFRSTTRNSMQFFSDQITTGATEVNAGIVISDVAYSPDQNVLVWVPRGSFGSTPTLYSTTVNPALSLVGIGGSGPTFGSDGVTIYNEFLTSFLVAGKGPNTKIFRLDVKTSPAWIEVYTGEKLLSSLLESMTITCLGVSPSCECICGSVNGNTSVWFRIYQNTTWQKAIFEQPGLITAVCFVGFGWYLCTWDPSIKTDQGFGLSSLWFASNNFTVIVYVDSWDAVDRSVKVNSISFYNSAQEGVCPDGYEQSSDNPDVCYKICPDAYEGINDLCAMRCPPGFAVGSIPQFCYPSRYTPARTHPVRPNMRNTISVPQTSDFNANVGPEANTSTAIKWAVGVSSAVALGGALAISLLK